MKLGLAPRDMRALVLGIAVLTPLLVARFVLLPFAGTWLQREQQLRAERDLYLRELSVVRRTRENLARQRSVAGQVIAGRRRLILSDQPNLAVASALSYIDSIARESQLDLGRNTGRNAESIGRDLTAVTIDVSGTSDFEGVLGFVLGLEKGPRLLHMPTLAIEAGASTLTPGSPQSLALKAEIRLYSTPAEGR